MTNSIAEIEFANVILIAGSNTTETHPIIGSLVKRARKRGAYLIVIDPRKTDIARLAHLHLQLRVGTDAALVNGMMAHIIAAGLANTEFIAGKTEGFDAFKEGLAGWSVERAAEISRVPAASIRAAAEAYAQGSASTILYTMGITQHICGVNNVRTMANLALLCGQIGRPSTGVNPLRGQNNVQGACDMGALPNVFTAYQKVDDPDARAKFETAWGVEKLPAKPGLAMTEAFDRFGKEIKAFICFGENPAVSEPDVGHARAAMAKLDFMVVLDLFKTETAEFADVILPCSTFAEIDGTYTSSERKVLRGRKAVEAPGESQPVWWIMSELARRLGYELNCHSPEQIWDQEISELSPSLKGIKYAGLEHGGLQWPKPRLDHPGTPYLHVGGAFTRGKGAFAVIDHVEPAESPDDQYPLWLTTGRRLQQYHTSTMTRRAKGLSDLLPSDSLEISAADAAALGVADGEEVTVRSRRGELKVKAGVTDRVPPGTVFMSFHFWEANANVLTNAALDPIAKIPEYKACAVRVSKD